MSAVSHVNRVNDVNDVKTPTSAAFGGVSVFVRLRRQLGGCAASGGGFF
jgi:hypothetical protein